MAARFGSAPSPLSSATSIGGGFSPQRAAPYNAGPSGLGNMSMPRPGYTRLNSNSAQPNNPPSHMSNGGPQKQQQQQQPQPQMLRQPSGGSRPDKKDTKKVAWVHWRALKDFLASWIDKESPTARASAREKLTRLTRLQFLELSTDVYDELMRRLSVERGSADNAAPFLPVRDDFHPKRNQARQKLATLPKNRFKDLASDVFFELRRRYPEFEEDPGVSEKYDEPQQGQGQAAMGYHVPQNSSPYNKPTQLQQGSQIPQRQGSGGARPGHQRQGSSAGGRSIGSNMERGGMEELSNGDRLANFTAATNDVVVPNKSRLQEEEIEVPYARDSTLTLDMDPRNRQASGGPGPSGLREFNSESLSSHGDHRGAPSRDGTVTSPNAADTPYFDRMSFASNVSRGNGPQGLTSPNSWEDHENKIRTEYEMRVVTLERRLQSTETERDDLKRQLSEQRERRKDYEDEVRGLKERATTHASSLRSLQHELDLARDAADSVRGQSDQASRAAQEEIAQWRERCEGLEDEVRRLEEERQDEATRSAHAPVDHGMVSELKSEVRNLVEELSSLSVRHDELLAEREKETEASAALEARIEDYKRQFNAARTELRNLKATSTLFVAKPLTDDHLPASADGNIADTNVTAFQTAIDTLLMAARSSHPSGVLPAMKAIVEAVTNIGEDVKQFEEDPNLDVDPSRLESLKHESTTCLSGLMNAARNHAMASGLSPVSLIDAAAGHLSVNVVELIKLLKIRRSGKTREILNSRMSIGDMVRRGSENAQPTSPVPRDETSPRGNNLSANLPNNHDRVNSYQSAASTAQRSDSFSLEQSLKHKASSTSMATSDYDPRQSTRDTRPDPYARSAGVGQPLSRIPEPTRGHSHNVSAASMTSEQNYDQRNGYDRFEKSSKATHMSPKHSSPKQAHSSPKNRHESPPTANGKAMGNEQEWADLQPYLNTQSSSLVNSIQNLLAAIRTGGLGPALNEHLSEVIAISSSIVAVSGNALPSRMRPAGEPLLSDLTDNTDRLSEAQQQAAREGGFDKQLRQSIASASFGVAKALKALMKLGNE